MQSTGNTPNATIHARLAVDIKKKGKNPRFVCTAPGVFADEDDVVFHLDEGQPEEVLHLVAVDLLGPAPVELVEGFDHREAGGFDASLGGPIHA